VGRVRNRLINGSAALFRHTFFGGHETFLHNFQVVVAVAKFNHQLGQGNHVLDLKTQRTPAPPTHFFQFCPLFFRHADVELKRFFGHCLSLPDRNFDLMGKYD